MDDKYQKTYTTWNKIAQLYEDAFMDLELYNDTYAIFCEAINNKDASILEVGCGPGNITKHLLELLPNSQILATDVSENMIALAKKNFPTVDFMVMDCRNIGILHTKFDAIMCGFTIPYISKTDCATLFASCSNLLKKKGVLYMSFVAGNYEDSKYISGSTGDSMYFYYHELATIQHELKTQGFTLISSVEKEYKKSDGTLEIHTILIARK